VIPLKILLVVAYFVPEIGSAAHVYFDLAKAFVKNGHEVDVITSYPRPFNLGGKDIGKNLPLNETIDGVNVHRCKHSMQRDNVILRGIEHFVLPSSYFKTYKRINKKFDVCLIYVPPLPLFYLARKIKKYDGTKSVLNFQDFHPQELTDVGVMKNPLWIKIMEFIEKQAYKYADFITVISHGGIDYIVKRGGDSNKIKHVYNGVLLEDIKRYITKKDFKKREGIENKFLVSYAGILSPYQGIDNILDAAKQLENYGDIILYIVGDGSIKKDLEERVKNENISNVKLLPFQPRDEYFNIINSSDISLVSLDERMNAPCLPGKMINLMGIKQPIIACVPLDSEAGHLINNSKCGVVVKPGNIEEFAKIVLELKNNDKTRKQMGLNGYLFLEENMNLEKNTIIYENIFRMLFKN